MRINYLPLVTVGLALALAGLAQAQEEAESTDNEPMEEITAYGQKNLLNLKYAAIRAEDDFFNRFNELNQIDEFDVFCGKEPSTYSRIKRRTCWSPFERETDQDEIDQAIRSGGRVGGRNEGYIRQKRKEQAEHLKKMVLENPELQQLYVQLGEANLEFATERDRRCAGGVFCNEKKSGEAVADAAESKE